LRYGSTTLSITALSLTALSTTALIIKNLIMVLRKITFTMSTLGMTINNVIFYAINVRLSAKIHPLWGVLLFWVPWRTVKLPDSALSGAPKPFYLKYLTRAVQHTSLSF